MLAHAVMGDYHALGQWKELVMKLIAGNFL